MEYGIYDPSQEGNPLIFIASSYSEAKEFGLRLNRNYIIREIDGRDNL